MPGRMTRRLTRALTPPAPQIAVPERESARLVPGRVAFDGVGERVTLPDVRGATRP